MRKLLTVAAALLLTLTLFFSATGLVYDEGGFGVRLVLKPALSSEVQFGGGEDGTWQRLHPEAPRPWWQQGGLRVLVDDDWEQGYPTWVNLYLWGFIALVFVLWPLFGFVALARLARAAWRRRRQGS